MFWLDVQKRRGSVVRWPSCYLLGFPDSCLFPQSGGFMDMFGMMNDMIGNMVRKPCSVSSPGLFSVAASMAGGEKCASEGLAWMKCLS